MNAVPTRERVPAVVTAPATASHPASRPVVPTAPAPRPVGARESRWAAIGVLALVVPLPVQWQVLLDSPFGVVRYFHLGALVLVLIHVVAVPSRGRTFRGLGVIVVGMAVLSALCMLSAVVYGYSWAQPAQHAVYFLVGVVLADVLGAALGHPAGRRLLVWCAPLAVTWTLAEIRRNMAVYGLDPFALLVRAVRTGDPNIVIFGVFGRGLAILKGPVGVSARHEVVAALLVAAAVTVLAGHVGYARTAIGATACVAACALVLLSLSRAVLIAPALAILLGAARAGLRMSFGRSTVPVLLGALGVAVLAGPRFADLILVRFVDDTGSYDARLDTLDLSARHVVNRALNGGPDLGFSTHTLIGDSFLRAGWPAGLAAVVVLGAVAVVAYRAARSYLVLGGTENLVAFAMATLLVVRGMTAGNGYVHQVEWVAFGIAVAVARARVTRSDEPDPVSGTPGR